MIVPLLAAAASLGGALLLYLAAPYQALLARRLHRRRVGWTGVALMALALVLLLTLMGPATAVFTWTTAAMLVWSIVPVAARWWRFREKTRA